SRRMLSEFAQLRAEYVSPVQIAPDRDAGFQPWELRTEALLRCRWREVLLLDTTPLAENPEGLFGDAGFADTGALFRASPKRRPQAGLWQMCALTPPEIGLHPAMFVIDKHRCWSVLLLARWMNEHAYLFHQPAVGEFGV